MLQEVAGERKTGRLGCRLPAGGAEAPWRPYPFRVLAQRTRPFRVLALRTRQGP